MFCFLNLLTHHICYDFDMTEWEGLEVKPGDQLASEGQMEKRRDQKALIRKVLTASKKVIDSGREKAVQRGDGTFVLAVIDDLTASGLLTRDDVATEIRAWLLKTYEKETEKVYLDRFNADDKWIRFSGTNMPEKRTVLPRE